MLSYMAREPCGTIKLKSPGGETKMHNSDLGPWTMSNEFIMFVFAPRYSVNTKNNSKERTTCEAVCLRLATPSLRTMVVRLLQVRLFNKCFSHISCRTYAGDAFLANLTPSIGTLRRLRFMFDASWRLQRLFHLVVAASVAKLEPCPTERRQ